VYCVIVRRGGEAEVSGPHPAEDIAPTTIGASIFGARAEWFPDYESALEWARKNATKVDDCVKVGEAA